MRQTLRWTSFSSSGTSGEGGLVPHRPPFIEQILNFIFILQEYRINATIEGIETMLTHVLLLPRQPSTR